MFFEFLNLINCHVEERIRHGQLSTVNVNQSFGLKTEFLGQRPCLRVLSSVYTGDFCRATQLDSIFVAL